jgi:hypothetical protein
MKHAALWQLFAHAMVSKSEQVMAIFRNDLYDFPAFYPWF